MQVWNGVAFLPNPQVGAAVVVDASGTKGCGAYTRKALECFRLPWPASCSGTYIAAKELFPLVMAAAVWGKSWRRTLVQFWSDNQAVVAVLSTRSAHHPQLMHLLRCLFSFRPSLGLSLGLNMFLEVKIQPQMPCHVTALSNFTLSPAGSLLPHTNPNSPAANAA